MTPDSGGTLTIHRAGLSTTIQDEGRFGQLHLGLTTGGAIDGFSFRLGQRLVGNSFESAALELTLGGVELSADIDLVLAVTGAIVGLSIDDQTVPMNTTLRLMRGQRLVIGRAQGGSYSYVCISGGIATPPVLGSRSTVVREGLGGLNGDRLYDGAQLPVLPPAAEPTYYRANRSKAHKSDQLLLRFIPGFQYSLLPASSREALVSNRFQVSHQRNRMGVRLEGNPIMTGISRLWSEATCLGAIQVPPDGDPIVLLNDRQTIGGYPKIGAVLSVDCARLAQAEPYTHCRLEPLSPHDADRVLWLHQNYERELALETV